LPAHRIKPKIGRIGGNHGVSMSRLRILGWAKSIIPSLTLFFALAVLVANPAAAQSISGTVFEDQNYGGGAGRSKAAATGNKPAAFARVELFDSVGSYLRFTTTDASGFYGFVGLANGTFTVRVVNISVLSARTGSTALLIGVQTYRTVASSGSAVAVS
jgi:hypothetical protein